MGCRRGCIRCHQVHSPALVLINTQKTWAVCTLHKMSFWFSWLLFTICAACSKDRTRHLQEIVSALPHLVFDYHVSTFLTKSAKDARHQNILFQMLTTLFPKYNDFQVLRVSDDRKRIEKGVISFLTLKGSSHFIIRILKTHLDFISLETDLYKRMVVFLPQFKSSLKCSFGALSFLIQQSFLKSNPFLYSPLTILDYYRYARRLRPDQILSHPTLISSIVLMNWIANQGNNESKVGIFSAIPVHIDIFSTFPFTKKTNFPHPSSILYPFNLKRLEKRLDENVFLDSVVSSLKYKNFYKKVKRQTNNNRSSLDSFEVLDSIFLHTSKIVLIANINYMAVTIEDIQNYVRTVEHRLKCSHIRLSNSSSSSIFEFSLVCSLMKVETLLNLFE